MKIAGQPLYVSDLDGTLLRKDRSLSRFTRDTLNALVDQGLLFTVASARSIASMRHLLAGLSLRLPVVEFNGAFVSDLASGRHYLVNDLARDILPNLWQQISAAGHTPFISTFDGTADRCYYRDIANEGMAWYVRDRRRHRDPRMRYLADLESGLDDQVVCLTVNRTWSGAGEIGRGDRPSPRRARADPLLRESVFTGMALADHPRCPRHQGPGYPESQAHAGTGRPTPGRIWRP